MTEISKNVIVSSYERIIPTIYAYELIGVEDHKGYIKVGYTERDARTRIKEQLQTSGVKYKVLLTESAIRADGTCFNDHHVHLMLRGYGCTTLESDNAHTEWYKCTVKQIRQAIQELRDGKSYETGRYQTFAMRPEQERAVTKTQEYFEREDRQSPGRPPKFLWNAKMRFGKTFATYQLARRMGCKRVLILTFKPAVESSWDEDLKSHVDFEGWRFVSAKNAQNESISIEDEFLKAEREDASRPIVTFGSFQKLMRLNENGGIQATNEFIHLEQWDLVVFDEYHFGAWRANVKAMFEDSQEREEQEADFDPEEYQRKEAANACNEDWLPITAHHYLFLSGTPFRALNSGEFIEDQIFTWTYSDEQQAKESWRGEGNPYLALPRMVMMTYKLPDSITHIVQKGEFDEFDLNVFFSATGSGKEAQFVYQNEVQKWLDLIRGAYLPSNQDDMRLGKDKRPPMPYHDVRLLNALRHTLWYLPSVSSCEAMRNLLKKPINSFYHQYRIVCCAGVHAGVGLAALEPVLKAMDNPLEHNTIILSCGKLNTGVTIRPLSGVLMLRNLKSPETYFQTAFRAQSPWTCTKDDGQVQIIKEVCYVIDFALNRALRQVSDYSRQLNVSETDPERKVSDFIHFLPVLAYDGAGMRQISAEDILDFAMSGTSATLLAKRWESALLVNVDNETLKRLMASEEAMRALMSIEGFRSLNEDLTTIINKSEHVKELKKDSKGKLTKKAKQELTEEQKEYQNKRREIQEKLIKFATRIPVFMYLTDYRERCLKDVITQLEPELFKRVTGLSVKDFDLLCSLNVFNSSLMDDAVYKFKRYEDASLRYTGLLYAETSEVGGFETTMTRQEYRQLYS